MTSSPAQRSTYDAVVVGAGHNGLVAAAYLARAGLSVLVLERLAHVGGAAVSAVAFPGHPVRVPRYASLVSLLPGRVVDDLGLDLRLAPLPGRDADVPGGADVAALREWDDAVRALADVVAPTLLEPLPTERAVRGQVDPTLWQDLVARPLGEAIERRFTADDVRGHVALDGLRGGSVSLHDPSLAQNRSFLLHHLGDAAGGWRVPVGGAGTVSQELARVAGESGAELLTSAGVSRIDAVDAGAEVSWHDGFTTHTVTTRHVLAGVSPWVLRILLGELEDPGTKPEGALLKVNLLLSRLPRLRSGADPAAAFASPLRLGTGLDALEAAYADAAGGRVPDALPVEVHSPSLTDPSVLGGAPPGTQVLGLLGVHLPDSLFADDDREAVKALAVERALATLDARLEEPVAACLATDAAGRPCIEALTPHDVEADLAMPGGHPFHGDLDWPWAPNRALLDTPARQWGVQTDVASVLVCGSGARRGGGISGLGGHNAARAVLASL